MKVPSHTQVLKRPTGILKEKWLRREADIFLGFRLGSVEFTNQIKGLDVRNWIRTRCAADGSLIDEDDIVEAVGAFEIAEEAGGVGAFGLTEGASYGAIEHLVDK